jgi:hypothetical protein
VKFSCVPIPAPVAVVFLVLVVHREGYAAPWVLADPPSLCARREGFNELPPGSSDQVGGDVFYPDPITFEDQEVAESAEDPPLQEMGERRQIALGRCSLGEGNRVMKLGRLPK